MPPPRPPSEKHILLSTAGPHTPARLRRLGPLLGGLLLGTAMPVLGAADEPAPPPRLRLAMALEDFSPEPGGMRPGSHPAVASQAPGDVPRLRLAQSMTAGGGVPAAVDAAQPLVALVGRVLGEPVRGLVPDERRNPFTPLRSAAAVLVAANDDAAPLATDSAPSPPPAASGGADASVIGADATVIGDEEFLPADAVAPAPSTSRPPPTRGMGRTTTSSSRWGLAPIRWGGAFSAGMRQRRSDDQNGGRSSSSQLYETRLRASTFLIRHYIAQVSGDFALNLVRDQTSDSVSSNNLTGTSITGDGTLSIFPQSRFPFQGTLALSDSRTDGSLTNQDTRRTRLSLRQDYRPEIGNWRVSAQYDRSNLTGGFGNDTLDILSAGYSDSTSRQSWSANGSLSRNEGDEQSSEYRFGVARHTYNFSDALLIESTATYTDQQTEENSLSNNAESVQLFSFASWSPYDSPWRGTANLRFIETETTFEEASNKNRNFSGAGSLRYEVNRNLNLSGTFSANVAESSNGRELSTNQGIGAGYSSDVHMLEEYAYNWFASGFLSNSTAGEGGSRSADASIGHSLQRNWQPTELTLLSGSLNQSVSTNRSTGAGSFSSTALSHSASLTLQTTPSERLSGFLSASLSDTRVSGDDTSSFQLLNVQASGRWRINALSEMNSNLTWQLARQEDRRSDDFGVSTSTASQSSSLSGSFSYGHIRAFGIRNLRYTLDFRANTSNADSRASGNIDAERERVTLDLDQRLRYRIGRLDTELQVRMAEIEGRREGLIFFKVTRAFGGF